MSSRRSPAGQDRSTARQCHPPTRPDADATPAPKRDGSAVSRLAIQVGTFGSTSPILALRAAGVGFEPTSDIDSHCRFSRPAQLDGLRRSRSNERLEQQRRRPPQSSICAVVGPQARSRTIGAAGRRFQGTVQTIIRPSCQGYSRKGDLKHGPKQSVFRLLKPQIDQSMRFE